MNIIPARECRMWTDPLTVPGYVATVTRCFWRHSVFENPHYRIQVQRADGVSLWVDTLPAGTSAADAVAVSLMRLRVEAAIDLRRSGERWAA